MLLSNKWYYENTATIILTEEGARVVDSALTSKDVCPECGERLVVITMVEGSFIGCPVNMYHKSSGYKIYHGDYSSPPKIIRPKEQAPNPKQGEEGPN